MLQNDPLRLPPFHFDANPDPAFLFDADVDPDPAPAPAFQLQKIMGIQCGSGSENTADRCKD
jgi:hypothetical protein